MSETLFLCEKPSQAADLAAALGNAVKRGPYWTADGGAVVGARGHMLELVMPEDYDPKYKQWAFEDLPIVPKPFRVAPVEDCRDLLKTIGELLKQARDVVIATDAGREGEMIGWEILDYFKFNGPVRRLWVNDPTEEGIRGALRSLLAGNVKKPQYFAAKARSHADWLIGMNCTRAMTKKTASQGVVSIGRVQTPTVALVVRRDREIEQFRARNYFEIVAEIATQAGKAALRYAPKDEARLFEQDKAQAIVTAASGAAVTLRRTAELKKQQPPALFTLSALQKKANTRWGWPIAKTLELAQELYEKYKLITYPRADCPYLVDLQAKDVPDITEHLVSLDPFKHLHGQAFTPRSSVFNTQKAAKYDHPAIIPTKKAAALDAMPEDARKLYVLIASYYLASLMPDYEFLKTTLAAEAGGVTFTTAGLTPKSQGWRTVSGKDDEEDEESNVLPDIPDGTAGTVDTLTIETKQTRPPARYTEGTLSDDMENVAKYVTDAAKRSRLKNAERAGIGTPATRAAIVDTIKARGFVAPAKGNQIISTEKARELIALLEAEMPALADAAETAVWDESLEGIASGNVAPEAFVADICRDLDGYLAILAKKADAVSANAPVGVETGSTLAGVPILDHGEFYTARGAFAGRIYKDVFGHVLTSAELVQLIEGKAILEVQDCTKKDGTPSGPKKLRFEAPSKTQPFAKVVVVADAPPAVATTAASPRKGGGAIQDHGEWYTVPGYEVNGYPVRFYKTICQRTITPDELSAILASKKEGVKLSGFISKANKPFETRLIYNARKQPRPGLDFKFD